MAIKTEDSQAVIKALALTNVERSGWTYGIDEAYLERVFVSPPIKGWVFAVCRKFPTGPYRDLPDELTPLLTKIAKEFSEVQFFGTYRVAEYHAWARAINGKIVRQYGWLGEDGTVIWNRGYLTAEEVALGLKFDKDRFPNEDHVMQIAGACSIDPSTIEEMSLKPSVGYLGSLPKK